MVLVRYGLTGFNGYIRLRPIGTQLSLSPNGTANNARQNGLTPIEPQSTSYGTVTIVILLVNMAVCPTVLSRHVNHLRSVRLTVRNVFS